MVSLYVQGPVAGEKIKNILNIIRCSDGLIRECFWVYTGQNEFDDLSDENIKFVSVADPGPVDVAVPPHYANTNRMIATTKKIIDFNFSSSHILKIRSDVSLRDEYLFRSWLQKVVQDKFELNSVSRANHNWSLPFNMCDWIFFGTSSNLKNLISNLAFVPNSSGKDGVLNTRRLLFGYYKSGFSPQYTTEQVFGGMLFDCKKELNSLWGFNMWLDIKKNRIQNTTIEFTGLECKKHNHYVGKAFEFRSGVVYAFVNFFRNLARLILS